MADNILDMEKDFEIKVLNDKINDLKNENTKLKIILKEAGISDDIGDISDEEAICIQEIQRLKKLSDQKNLTSDDIKNFDTLNKNLRLIRGTSQRGRASSFNNFSNEELKKQLKK